MTQNRFSQILSGRTTAQTSTPNTEDPRPDLTDDTQLWDAVLKTAKAVSRGVEGRGNVWGLLHGLRCGGARITVRDNGKLHMDYMPLVNDLGWDKNKLLNDWLKPLTKEIMKTFAHAQSAMEGPRRPAWAQAS